MKGVDCTNEAVTGLSGTRGCVGGDTYPQLYTVDHSSNILSIDSRVVMTDIDLHELDACSNARGFVLGDSIMIKLTKIKL